MRVNSLLARFLNTAGPTFRRFWVPVGFTIGLATTLIMATYDYAYEDNLIRIAMALSAGVLASWCAILFWEREPRMVPAEGGRMDAQLAGNLIALPIAGAVSALTYMMLKTDFRFVSTSRHMAITLFLSLACFVIPHYRKEGSLEMYVARLFSHAFVSALFSAVMFFGLTAITFTVSSLFDLNIDYRIYLRLFIIMSNVLAPFLFMAGIPVGTVSNSTVDYPKVLKNLVLYVVTPLLTAYTAVLYVYFAKILLTREWPVGLVAPLVLWYSMVSAAILYFVWPLARDNKWGETFTKYFPIAVIPLLLMMFTSVGIRIRYYGITENRYYVVVFGIWVLSSMVYLIVTKARNKLLLPITLAIVAILSVFGPWSSFSIAKASQNKRLEDLLTKYGMLEGKTIVHSTENVPLSDRREFAEILFYFDRYHDLSDIRLLPPGFQMDRFQDLFGFSYFDTGFPGATLFVRYEAKNQAVDLSGYQYMFDYTRFDYGPEQEMVLSQGSIGVSFNRNTLDVAVTRNGQVEWEKSLRDYVKGLVPQSTERGEVALRPEDMTLTAETDSLRVKIVITGLWGEHSLDDNEIRVNQLLLFLLVGEK